MNPFYTVVQKKISRCNALRSILDRGLIVAGGGECCQPESLCLQMMCAREFIYFYRLRELLNQGFFIFEESVGDIFPEKTSHHELILTTNPIDTPGSAFGFSAYVFFWVFPRIKILGEPYGGQLFTFGSTTKPCLARVTNERRYLDADIIISRDYLAREAWVEYLPKRGENGFKNYLVYNEDNLLRDS